MRHQYLRRHPPHPHGERPACGRQVLPPWIPPARVGSRPHGRPLAATPPQARTDVTPRVELSGRTRRRRRRAPQPRWHRPQSMPVRQEASVRREMAARASVGRERQHARPPSRELPRTAHRPEALRQRFDSDRPLGSSREIPHHLQRVDRRQAPVHQARRRQPETPRVVRDQVGRCRPPLHQFGPR